MAIVPGELVHPPEGFVLSFPVTLLLCCCWSAHSTECGLCEEKGSHNRYAANKKKTKILSCGSIIFLGPDRRKRTMGETRKEKKTIFGYG